MKKSSLFCYIVLAVCINIWIWGEILMCAVLPLDITQQFVQQQTEQILGRSVHIGHIGLGWRGLSLDNLRIESKQPSEEKSMISAKRARVYWSLRGLLIGKIKFYALRVEEPTFHLIRYKDGSLNLSDFSEAEEPQADTEQNKPDTQEPLSLNLQIKNFELTDGEFLFTDQVTEKTLEISKISGGIKDLQPLHTFPFFLNAQLRYSVAGKPVQEIKAGLSVLLNLGDFDWSRAQADIRQFIISHSGGKVILRGQAENVFAPKVNLELSVIDFSDEFLRAFEIESPKFLLKQLTTKLAGSADIENKQATVSSLTIQGLDSFVSAEGSGNFAEKPVFSAQGNFELDLATIGQALDMLSGYRLTGKLQGKAQGTQDNFSGEMSAQNVGAVVDTIGNLSDIGFQLNVADKDHAALQNLIGKINSGSFTGELTAKRTARGIEIDAKANAPRIALPPLSNQTDTPQEATSASAAPEEKPSALPPFYVKSAVDIGSLDAPFIYGENISLRTDLGKLTPALDQVQGTMSLSIAKGEIKDLAQLTRANIVTNVLFGSLDVVGRVINSLNVLSVLHVFNRKEKGADRSDDMVVQTIVDENGQEQHILVPYEAGAYNDIWKFKSFGTEMYFSDGVGDIKKGLFRSDRMSFNLTGQMNFETRALNMNVQAAPGLHQEDGVMPLSVHIGGTMDDPQGSMKMMSSAMSMVTQGVTNNFASRTVKKGVGGLFGLFKKKPNKSQETDLAEETDESAETNPPAEDHAAK